MNKKGVLIENDRKNYVDVKHCNSDNDRQRKFRREQTLQTTLEGCEAYGIFNQFNTPTHLSFIQTPQHTEPSTYSPERIVCL